jgi:hypothetical protein
MSVSGISPAGRELSYSGLYLPSIGLGYLYIQRPPMPVYGTVDLYLLGCILSLLSGIVWHELLKSLSGPQDNSTGPMAEAEVIQRIGFTLFGVGTPSEYPDTYSEPIWSTDLEIPTTRYLVFGVFCIACVILAITFPYTIWELTHYAADNSSVLPGAIVFLELVFLLRTFLPNIWPSIYLIESYEHPSINESVEQFAMAFWDDGRIQITGGQYDPAGGGSFELTYQTQAETVEDERELLEELIVAYAGTILPDDFPCQEFRLTVYEDDSEVATSILSSESVREFRAGSETIGPLLDEVLESMTFDKNSRPTGNE